MKPILTLALALTLAPFVSSVVKADDAPAAPAAPAAQPAPDPSVYWDPKLVVGSDPYALNGSDLDGKKLALADYKGKVLLIDFWATWCPPCRAEIPNVLANYAKYHDQGFEVLGVSLDNTKAALTDYIKANQMPWQQTYDHDLAKEGNANHYGVKAIPFMLIIGKDGKIAAVNARGDALEPALKAALAK